MHNGVIQLWDYRIGVLLEKFDEHDGPVRGIHFHVTQPILVSGGDDYKIKVWDFKLRRCLFTLLGHLDYIRTVEFHPEYPWIVSCSDDQTVRIWNWQSRSCVSVLAGHNHYVMSACFHPKEDLVASSSLDQTVRIWDTSGLRKKTVRGAPSSAEDMMPSRVNSDIFGGSDAVVKYVLEGHDRGVNFASFHPTLPLIVSSADDRQIKLWRMNETKAWEVDTMRGHTNNVSCVLFHPRHELIVSNSEDRSIRVWDISKRLGVQTFQRENDRFWILAAHPSQNLLAAGHDSGMIVFKLERERPALEARGGRVFYVKERYLRMLDFQSDRDMPVVSLRRTGTMGTGLGNVPKVLNYNGYNPAENNVLLHSDAEGGTYELLCFSKDGSGQTESQETRRGAGMAAVFVARNRFAVLDRSSKVTIKNFQNEVTKVVTPSTNAVQGTIDGLYYAGTVGRVLLRADDKIYLYETQSRRVLAEIQAPNVKYVIWSDDCQYVALISKHAINIADKQLTVLSSISESVRIKSGIWDDNGTFIYTTLNHIKYGLNNGDTGIIRTLDVPVYLTCITGGNTLHCLDREGKAKTIAVDLTECNFKIALNNKNYAKVMHMVQHSRLCGKAIITYLTEKEYPEVALHFVKDEKTRFNLAISCGNLEVAPNSAYELENEECWKQLGLESLRQGNVQVVEMAYQRTKDFERLSFLYLITGNREKLQKMMKISEMRNDVMGRFHNALYLGDAVERVKILKDVGQLSLAYLTAKSHGLQEECEAVKSAMLEIDPDFSEDSLLALDNPSFLLPPVPILQLMELNWPLLPSNEPSLKEISRNLPEEPPLSQTTGVSQNDAHPWAEDDDDFGFSDAQSRSRNNTMDHADVTAGAKWDHDLDFGEDDLDISHGDVDANAVVSSNFVAAPTVGVSPQRHWVNNSSVAADHVAAGSFETAMKLLHLQIGIINFAPLQPLFMSIYTEQMHCSRHCQLPYLSQFRCSVRVQVRNPRCHT